MDKSTLIVKVIRLIDFSKESAEPFSRVRHSGVMLIVVLIGHKVRIRRQILFRKVLVEDFIARNVLATVAVVGYLGVREEGIVFAGIGTVFVVTFLSAVSGVPSEGFTIQGSLVTGPVLFIFKYISGYNA